jgi:hypothetical protein
MKEQEEAEIKKLIENEVAKQLKIEKKKLASKIKYKLEYTGEFAKCSFIIKAVDDWAKF